MHFIRKLSGVREYRRKLMDAICLCELNEELDVVKTNAAGKMKAYIVTGISAGLILVIVLI